MHGRLLEQQHPDAGAGGLEGGAAAGDAEADDDDVVRLRPVGGTDEAGTVSGMAVPLLTRSD